MRRTLIALLISALCLLLATACGDDELDNVGSCQQWAAQTKSLSCGGADMSKVVGAIDCTLYEGLVCDISGYFTCLTDNTKCVNNKVVTTGWPSCAKLTKCQ